MSPSKRGRADDVPWQRLFEQTAAPTAVLDLQGYYLHVNAAACQKLGYTEEQLLGWHYHDITHPDDIDPEGPLPSDLLLRKRYITATGEVIWVLLSRSLIRDDAGEPELFLSQFQDVTDRHEAKMLWERSFDHAPIGMALLDLHGKWTAVNDTLCEITGHTREEMLYRSFLDVTYPEDADRGSTEFAELVRGQRDSIHVEKRYRHKRGYPISVLIRATTVPGADGHPAYVVAQYEEISDRRIDAHLAHLALHDPLTGLANRLLMSDRINHALEQLARGSIMLAVILADLDGLKAVNDLHGHAFGDKLLIAAAQQLSATVRSGDTVARLGGDEFVIISLVPDRAAAEKLRDDIVSRMQSEYVSGEFRASMGASVGLATTEQPTTSPDSLLHMADRDMYERKDASQRGS